MDGARRHAGYGAGSRQFQFREEGHRQASQIVLAGGNPRVLAGGRAPGAIVIRNTSFQFTGVCARSKARRLAIIIRF